MYGYGGSAAAPQQQFGGLTSFNATGAAAGGYGAAKAPALRKQRPQISLFVVLICLLAPIAVFGTVCGALSLSIRRSSPALAWFAVALYVRNAPSAARVLVRWPLQAALTRR
mmetsp:Transcript_124625/g.399069  ORF Transcript_124625/g.399069 Transcript_124625/m.399069 type:complete len:112 (+) Transcript_124625:900-1235(+)